MNQLVDDVVTAFRARLVEVVAEMGEARDAASFTECERADPKQDPSLAVAWEDVAFGNGFLVVVGEGIAAGNPEL